MSEETQFNMDAVASYLGINAEDLDTFKTSFESEFIRKSNVKDDSDLAGAIVGKRLGTIETAIRSAFRKAGFGLEDGEGKGMKVEELIDFAVTKASDGWGDKIKQLESEGLKDKDEAFLELQGKYDKLKLRAEEDRKMLDVTKNEFATYKEDSANRFKQNRIDSIKAQVFGKATFKKGMNELERKGFENELSSNYILDLDEQDNLVVTDKGGNRIPNPAVTGTYMNFEEVLRAESIKHGLYPMNEKATKTSNIVHNLNTDVEAETTPKRQIKRTYRK